MNQARLTDNMRGFVAHLDVRSASRTAESSQFICLAEKMAHDITGTERLEVE